MNLIKATTKFCIRRITLTPVRAFAGDSWKDRDEAAEKVYISTK